MDHTFIRSRLLFRCKLLLTVLIMSLCFNSIRNHRVCVMIRHHFDSKVRENNWLAGGLYTFFLLHCCTVELLSHGRPQMFDALNI